MTDERVERVKITKVIVPTITVEQSHEAMMVGDREIWARHEEAPQVDGCLATVHYHQCYQHNANIDDVAARVAAALSVPRAPITEGEVEQRARELLAAECGGVVAHALETGNSRLVDVRAETALRAIVKALSVPSTVRSTPTPEGDRQ